MGCCLVAALVISVLRRVRYAVLPGQPPVTAAFAPSPRRPAPGTMLVGLAAAPPATAPPARLVSAPVAAGLAVLAYVTAVALLDAVGLLVTGDDPLVGWTARDLGAAALLVAALLAAAGTTPRARSRLDDVSVACIAAGATWTALAIVDMHVLGLFELGTVGDVLLHGSGLALLMTGLALHAPPKESSR